jgi:hypothetical protein
MRFQMVAITAAALMTARTSSADQPPREAQAAAGAPHG